MFYMDNSEFIAHALRDYLRPLVPEAELKDMDLTIFCGEADAAILEGVSFALEYEIALPPLFREKVLELGPLPLGVDKFILEALDRLPAYWQQAS